MTFEETLKRLAEKEPEKFCYQREEKALTGELVQLERFWLSHKQWHLLVGREPVTQDFIDAILAGIGWECEASKSYSVDQALLVAPQWQAFVWKRQVHYIDPRDYAGAFPTKLEAAKAALIAVVEREYPL